MSEENTNQPQSTAEVTSAADNSEVTTTQVETTEEKVAVAPPTEEVTNPPVEEKKEEEPPKEEKLEEIQIKDINDDTEVESVLTERGLDYQQLQDEFYQYGDLTPETKALLESKGITGELLDSFVEGRKALVEKAAEDILNSIGGRDEYESIVNWASANLSEKEKAEIDSIHSPEAIKVLLRGLKAKMEDVDGVVPQQVQGGGGQPSADLFESMAEMQAAILDPRYAKDEVYREKVSKKITASREAGRIKL